MGDLHAKFLLRSTLLLVAAFGVFCIVALQAIASPMLTTASVTWLYPLTLLLLVMPFWTGFHALAVLRERQADRRPPRARRLAVTALAICAAVFLCLSLLDAALLRKPTESQMKLLCLSQMSRLSKTMRMYATDWDGILPPAAGWCDLLEPYVEGKAGYVCGAQPGLTAGYAYNSAVAGTRFEDLGHEVWLVVIFESDRGWNATGGPELLPREPRHRGGDNYVFADGSARWATRERAKELLWEPVLKETE